MRLFLKYLVSTDRKVIGLLYAFTSLFFLLVGFFLVVIIPWQLAFPGQPVPTSGRCSAPPTRRAASCCPSCMRGFYTIHTDAEYQAWLAEETALLAAP